MESFLLRISEAPDIVWCGARNTLLVIIGVFSFIKPATLCILVTSSASSKLKSGSIEGIHFAIMVFPRTEVSLLECNYALRAAATSKALFTLFCPFTLQKSIEYFSLLPKIFSKLISSFSIITSSFKYLINSFKLSTPITSIFWTIAASFAFSLGSIILSIPSFAASKVIGNTPVYSVYFSGLKIILLWT